MGEAASASAIVLVPLDMEQRHAGLFRPTPAPLPAGSDKAADLVDVTLLVEGLENTLSVAMAFPYATALGLPGIGRARHVPPIKGDVIFVRDGDEPGCPADKSLIRGIDHLLLTGTKTVRVTATPLDEDANSILQSGGVEALRALIRAAEPAELSLDGEMQRLARIRDPIQFAQACKAAAKAYGVPRALLRPRLRRSASAERGSGGTRRRGRGTRTDALARAGQRYRCCAGLGEPGDRNYVVASRAVRDTAVMWSLFSHFVHHPAVTFMIGARLGIIAVSPMSGKTTLLSAVQQLAHRPMPAASLTPALVNRVIDPYRPTLLIDEAEKLLRSNRNPELIALLNASHNRLYANIPRLVPTSDGGWQVGMFQLLARPCIHLERKAGRSAAGEDNRRHGAPRQAGGVGRPSATHSGAEEGEADFRTGCRCCCSSAAGSSPGGRRTSSACSTMSTCRIPSTSATTTTGVRCSGLPPWSERSGRSESGMPRSPSTALPGRSATSCRCSRISARYSAPRIG